MIPQEIAQEWARIAHRAEESATALKNFERTLCTALAEVAVLTVERDRAREVLKDVREFISSMTKPVANGVFQISSYHPCQALIDKIDKALPSAHEQTGTDKP